MAAWLGVDDFANLIGRFPFNNEKGYLAVKEYLANDLVKTLLSEITAAQEVAVAA